MRDDERLERAFVGDVWVTFEQEAALLRAWWALYPGPFRCAECGTKLTPATQWKPKVAMVGNDDGVYRLVVDVLCGTCARLFTNGPMRPGYGTDAPVP